MTEKARHRMEILWSAAWQFTQLNALVISNKSAVSQLLSPNMSLVACTAALEPAVYPARMGLKLTSSQCNIITNSIRVALTTQFYMTNHLRIPIECTPRFLSNSIKLQVVNFTLRHQMI